MRHSMYNSDMRFSLRLVAVVTTALLARFDLVAAAANPASAKVDYNRDIRPLFSDTCFKCHGPDEHTRKAKLRLDTQEGAFAALKGGKFALKPGDLAKSEVYRRITTSDPDDLMPPPDSKLALTKPQI